MADELLYENVPVGVRDRGESVEVGLVIDGAFLAFGSFKAQGFRDDIAEAQAAADAAKSDKKKSG